MAKRFLLGTLIGFGAGYVFGTKAGREKYAQLKQKAEDVWEDPRVRKVVRDAQEKVKETTPVVQAKVVEAAKSVKAKVGGGGDESPAPSGTPSPSPDI